MAKNDFDMDFDFEKEYGFDPQAVLDSDFSDEDLDLSQFADELGIDLTQEDEKEEDFSDFDVDSLDLGEDLDLSAVDLMEDVDLDLGLEDEQEAEEPEESPEEPEDDLNFDEDFDDEDDFADVGDDLLDFSRRASFFGVEENAQTVAPEVPAESEEAYEEAYEEQPAYDEEEEDVPEGYDAFEDEELDDEDEDEKPARRKKPAKAKEPIKLTMPPVFAKLWKLYFPPKEEWEPKPDPNNPRRRKKKSKMQIIKEFYLPPVIAGVALVLIVSFLAGALGNAITNRRNAREDARNESIAAESQAAQVQSEAEQLLEDAALLAAGYDYQGAIDLIDTFSGNIDEYQELTIKRSEYMNLRNAMTEYKDPSTIPNLSFHMLIADPSRAFVDEENGGAYNRNFVTIDEFSKILEQLYANNYVLVDFNSFVQSNTGVDGSEIFETQSLYLPEGKKPVMITETLVNYLSYMIDSNDDGVADSGGAGFASRLVVDASGSIEAEYVDANGQTQVGDYDLVPILEQFIADHPDFSYRGARATLAVCGYEGIFGYRITTDYQAANGQEYLDAEKAGAQTLVNALREKGYTLACYTYDNVAYAGKSATQVEADMNNWKNQIAPVIGDVDVLVYARNSDISDYSGNVFKVLYDAGIRYFVTNCSISSSNSQPSTTVYSSYIKQSRLLVTGESMYWYSSQFSGMFDTKLVLNSLRGDVPKSK